EVLALSQTLFNRLPEAYVMGIRGNAFHEFGAGLSDQARANLQKAATFIDRVISDGRFAESECGQER
ncbi:MAG: hypothetical protein WCS01_01065, partial [bacterium]